MTDINYVMACYFGARQGASSVFDTDRLFYVRKHIDSLERLSHKLSQITVVCSGADPGVALSHKIKDTKIVYIVRPNIGMSYGAYSDVFERYRKEFSHYIFTEDDYLFTHDNFDDLLIEEYNRRQCGMLCGYALHGAVDLQPGGVTKNHASVAIMIAGSDVLDKARVNVYCPEVRLPYKNQSDMFAGYFGQKALSWAVVDTGATLVDWNERWATAYWNSEPGIVRWYGCMPTEPWFGELDNRSLVVPVQALGRQSKVSDGKNWHTGVVDEHGVFAETP